MTTKNYYRFEIGDWVVHYYHGVGQVKDILAKGLGDNEKTFYKVTTDEIDYWIPVEDQDADHIEPIRTKEDFEKAIEVISSQPKPLVEHHKGRKKQIHKRWLDGDLISRAKLMRDLYGRSKLKKINFNEKEMLEKVKKYFLKEWVITDTSLSRKNAKVQLRKALKTGVKKAREKQDSLPEV